MAQSPSSSVFAPWDDPTKKPLIRFEGVTKRFGDFTAVDNLDLHIYEREFFALLGPSGCGKTTIMRILAGFDPPSEGTVWLDGVNIAPVPPNKRPVNMMFQSYALFPHLSVYDNIAFGLKRSPMPKSEIDGRVQEMLRLTRLEKFARRKPHQISGGQRQRVALARSLAKAPKLLLLDEPLGALDKKLRIEVQDQLKDIHRRVGTTFIYVTHDQEEALSMSDRIVIMQSGLIQQTGTPDEIYNDPANTFVAGFIGSPPMNFLPASVAGAVPAGAARVGVRPEHVQIEDGANGRAEAHVVYSEALGAETLVHARLNDGTIVTVRQDATRPRPEEGALVRLNWNADDQKLFDAAGQAVEA